LKDHSGRYETAAELMAEEVERLRLSSEKLRRLNLYEDLKTLVMLRSKLLPATSWMVLLK
jgi:hypothetical protein